eukprot:9401217-Heterocapsa_arctica.AAC.1
MECSLGVRLRPSAASRARCRARFRICWASPGRLEPKWFLEPCDVVLVVLERGDREHLAMLLVVLLPCSSPV